jgi:hypothetical protein
MKDITACVVLWKYRAGTHSLLLEHEIIGTMDTLLKIKRIK